jgi:outer membrane lipoprotein LolB
VLDDQQRAEVIRQGGWTITYDRYQSRAGTALPGRVSVQRDGVEVRLSIRRWQLGA